jgi:hypothetical protein
VIGTEDVRRGWRIRPRKVRIRVGAPMRFPSVGRSSPALAAGLTARIWACVNLQWEWLGGAAARLDCHEQSLAATPRRGRAAKEPAGHREARAA